MLGGRRGSEIRRNSSDTKGEQCLGHCPGRESQRSVLGTSSERPLNKPVTCKENLSRLKSISNALGSGKKTKCACMERYIYTYIYLAHSFQGNRTPYAQHLSSACAGHAAAFPRRTQLVAFGLKDAWKLKKKKSKPVIKRLSQLKAKRLQ